MKILALFLLLGIAINAVIFPNAWQGVLIALLVLGFILAAMERRSFPVRAVNLAFLSFGATFFYCLVGVVFGAPNEAILQAFFIYIVSPLLWLMCIDLAWRRVGWGVLLSSFPYLAIIASISVFAYYFLYLNYGPQAVEFFGSSANVHVDDEYAGAIIHVAGSLIFFGAAFFAAPNIIENKILRLMVLFLIATAVAMSGRTAAILGIVIGLLYFALFNIKVVLVRLPVWLLYFSLVGFVVYWVLRYFLQVDFISLLDVHFAKVSGGDTERPNQVRALLEGAFNYYFLGAGHGRGVDYIRSFDFPWRYEAVYFALLYKMGFLGTFLLLVPVIYVFYIFITKLIAGRASRVDVFFGSAFTAVVMAGFTNPYPEAFAFHWMYLLPMYYFFTQKRAVK